MMTQLDKHPQRLDASGHGHGSSPSDHGNHRLMMIACCIPMLLIAIALVVTGVAKASVILVAVACFAIMAVMMAGMGHVGNHE